MRPSDIRVLRTTLPSGLQVVVAPIKGLNTTTIGALVRTGSFDDPFGMHGIAHFVEHMMYKGSKYFTHQEFNRMLGERGIEANAYTNTNTVLHHLSGATLDVDFMLDTLIKTVGAPVFPAEEAEENELEKERSVVLDEFDYRSSSLNIRAYDNMMSRLYGKSRIYMYKFGMPVIGLKSNVCRLNREDLLIYHQNNYQQNNMTIIVVGDVDHEEMCNKIGELADAHLPKQTDFVKQSRTTEPNYYPIADEVDIVAGQTTSAFTLGWNINETAHDLVSAATDDIIEAILFNGHLSRFYNEIRERHGMCYQLYGYFDRHKTGGSVVASATIGADKIDECRQRMLDSIDYIATHVSTMSIDDYERAKNNCIRKTYSICDDTMWITRLLSNIICNSNNIEQINTLGDINSAISRVTAEHVRDVIEQFHRAPDAEARVIGK